MSLPPGFLDELRNRTSLAQVVGRKVLWDNRKSNQAKGDMWAPCPFHEERTASFHVEDRKGFYYCFGCHAKGDAIGFVQETENVGFMEAVEILAREAGMEMPRRDPGAKAESDRRSQLHEVMEAAFAYYRRQFAAGAGARARDYMAGRGLGTEACARWEVGFAPEARQGLFAHLRANGVAAELILEAGLAAEPERGGEPYDRFRDRVLFPIRDARGRAIALGGRALSPNARAKYLNSPETPLFDKGAGLYNHAPARQAAGKGGALLVAEGYMDVIALAEAGFPAAVAPLGTAITEAQLRLLWRAAPEPVIALDGDAAGQAAAMRVMDLALPLLEAGNGLRFCLMPAGADPDDLIRAEGAAGMRRRIEAAEPMVALLWRRETEGGVFDSPERRAALDKRLRAAIARITDASLRRHYAEEIKRRRWELFGPQRAASGRNRPRRGAPPARDAPLASTRGSLLAGGGSAAAEHLREAVILAALVTHPALVAEFEAELEALEPAAAEHRRLRASLLRAGAAEDGAALRARIEADIGPASLENLFATRHVRISPPVRQPDDADSARLCIAEEFDRLAAARGADREVAEAMEDMTGFADEGLTWRLGQAAAARNGPLRRADEDAADYDTAPNGARMNRAERSAFDRLLGEIETGGAGNGSQGAR